MADNRPFALAVLIVCVLGGGVVAAVSRTVPESVVTRAAAASAPTTTTAAPTTTTTMAAAPPTLPAEVATPKPPPRDGRARDGGPVVQIGTIEIPRIGLVHPVFEGNTLTQIDHGPSHWPGTALPGQAGNAVFAGHRVTHSHPFRDIDKLAPGDRVYFTINGVRTEYEVTGHEIVTPKDTWIIEQTPTATATLFACHPPHSARYRYVVRLALV